MSGLRAAMAASVFFLCASGTALGAPSRVSSVDEYFTRLPERFVPAEAVGLDAAIQWDIPGQGSWHAEIRDGALLEVARGPHASPSLRFRMAAEDLVGLANGDLSGRWLYVSARVKVEGSLTLAQRVGDFLPALH